MISTSKKNSKLAVNVSSDALNVTILEFCVGKVLFNAVWAGYCHNLVATRSMDTKAQRMSGSNTLFTKSERSHCETKPTRKVLEV